MDISVLHVNSYDYVYVQVTITAVSICFSLFFSMFAFLTSAASCDIKRIYDIAKSSGKYKVMTLNSLRQEKLSNLATPVTYCIKGSVHRPA